MSKPTATPKYATPLTKGAKSWAGDIRKAAGDLGVDKLIPWQDYSAKLIGELRPPTAEEISVFGEEVVGRGVPRRKTVILTVPRQSGKTIIFRSTIHAKAQSAPDLWMYGTADSRKKAAGHLEKMGIALTRAGVLEKATYGVGNERLVWPNQSRYEVFAPNEKGGHGDTVDLGGIDEAWTLVKEVLGGLKPGMITRPLSQLIVISTMGTLESEAWLELVKMGRESINDPNSSVGYLEYAAPDPDVVFDESQWHTWMPALGHTLTYQAIRDDLDIMHPNEFVRAYGNLTVASLVTVFPSEWVKDAWRVIEPPSNMVLAIDVNEEPAGGAISSGHLTEDLGSAMRVIEWRYGTPSWIPAEVKAVITKREVEAVVADFGGPARVLQAELTALCEAQHIPLVDRSPRDLGADTGSFYDGLRERSVSLEKSEPLELSITGAARKPLGDLWLVARRQMTADASPIISTILAHGLAKELGVRPVVKAFVL